MKGSAPAPAKEAAEVEALETPQIGIEDFDKIDLRVAEVKQVDKVKKADKLLCFQLDLGKENCAKCFQALQNSINQKN